MSDAPDASGFVPARQLHCKECGRDYILICGRIAETVCARCTTWPGWHTDPKLRELLEGGPPR